MKSTLDELESRKKKLFQQYEKARDRDCLVDIAGKLGVLTAQIAFKKLENKL